MLLAPFDIVYVFHRGFGLDICYFTFHCANLGRSWSDSISIGEFLPSNCQLIERMRVLGFFNQDYASAQERDSIQLPIPRCKTSMRERFFFRQGNEMMFLKKKGMDGFDT